ncbi:hypothetical protein ARMGADRAFT_804654 [Armillaria gallica]|uniref:Secreted protein n=1 Tax=Armillaria gallica TaxID=47427 RepID=A0A2H3E2L5_ARMGA|nr:hypothetical protein ARMGADRAFT_804654 [Armillaria gallica]
MPWHGFKFLSVFFCFDVLPKYGVAGRAHGEILSCYLPFPGVLRSLKRLRIDRDFFGCNRQLSAALCMMALGL